MPSLCDVLVDREPLLPELTLPLPCIATYPPEPHQQARLAICQAVQLGRLPPGTVLHGAHHCVLSVDGEPIQELLTHDMRGPSPTIVPPRPVMRTATHVERPYVLLTRYGFGTWGHWLGEIVPMVAVLEKLHPGRFRYAVPYHPADWYRGRIKQTLSHYRLNEDRILWIGVGQGPFVFHQASIVSPIWSGHTPHPHAISIMRHGITTEPRARVALLRRDWATRQIANGEAVEALLRSRGFLIADTARMPFQSQIALYATASHLFAVLGSGLTGLIYAPDAISVLTAAPTGWSDGFFHGITQLRTGARWTELRGPSQWDGVAGLMRDAPFQVPLRDLGAAID